MKFNRRHFCSALAIGSTGIVGGTVSAQSEVQITGTINSAVGADIEGVKLFFQQVNTNSFWKYTVPDSGDIDLTVSETGRFRVRSFDTSARHDNVPIVYSFGRTTVDDTGATVSYTLPQSYDVKIQCVDNDGTPVGDLPILLRAGGTSHRPRLLTTTEQGYVTFAGTNEATDQPVLQLAGPTTVEVSKNDLRQRLGEIDVTKNEEYTFQVSNTEKFEPNYIKVEANKNKGFNYPYFLYTPPSLKTDEESPRPILIEPNNIASPSDDFTAHLNTAKGLATESYARDIAERVGIPLLVPAFPRYMEEPQPWYVYVQALDPDTFKLENSPLERVDVQLLQMVDDARSRLESDGHTIASEVHINGFSASGTFTNRFTLIHPERVNAASYGGIKALTLPKTEIDGDIPVVGDPKWNEMSYPIGTEEEELPYPIGVANLEELTGKTFDKKAWLNTPQYIYVGDEDQPEPGSSGHKSFSNLYDEQAQQLHPSERSYAMPDLIDDIYGVKEIDERFQVSRAVYDKIAPEATITVYEGYGHTPRPAMDDLVDFHKNEIRNTYGSNSLTEDSSSGEGEKTTSGDSTNDESDGNDTDSNATSEESPGFGIGVTLSGIVGAGYMFKRRLEFEP